MAACCLLAADHNGTQVPTTTSPAWRYHRGWGHRVAEHPVQAKYTTICRHCHLSVEGADIELTSLRPGSWSMGLTRVSPREPCLFSVTPAPRGAGQTGRLDKRIWAGASGGGAPRASSSRRRTGNTAPWPKERR